MISRRELLLAAAGLALTGCVTNRRLLNSQGPPFWLATRNSNRVFLFGFGDARDRSWFTPTIERAFSESSEVWLENAPYHQQEPPSGALAAELEQLGYESGRTFFDALDPQVRERTLVYMSESGIKRESVELLRPWRAYYVLNGAYWSKKELASDPVHVEAELRELATAAGKRISYEMPTTESFVRFMAGMPDKAQSQYIEWLLDYIEEEKRGLHDQNDNFSWIQGKPGAGTLRSLERMRKMPDLYQAMQPQRNEWWARKIIDLLETNDTYFVAVGLLHVLGPDGIPQQLERLGITLESLS